MNLSTAKASRRAREVAMRKVLGASRTQVATQFLGEAIALVFLSLFFALVAVELVLPFYNEILGKELSLGLFEGPSLLLSLISLALAVGIFAGIYPALYLSRFLPGKILKSSKSTESEGSIKFRSVLVIFQFATSIILVISTLVVYGQNIFSNTMAVGYQSDNKLVLNIRTANENLPSLTQELLNLSEVTSVVLSSEVPSQDNENNNSFRLLEPNADGNLTAQQVINYHNMGYGFFEAYRVAPIAGRLFDEDFGSDSIEAVAEGEVGTASAIINMSALKKLGFRNPQHAIGKTLASNILGKQHLTIIGVIPDIYFRSIKFGLRASVYTLNPERFNVASISFQSNDIASLITKVEDVWQVNVPMQPIDLQFLSEMLSAQYQDELTTAQLFLVFSMIAIIIACLGLYGLSAFTVERRTKEIGIRKVMGASVKNIVALLIWQFSKPVVLANFIAWPIAVYLMLTWLDNFPYRLSALWLVPICLAVGMLSLMIAWITVGGNAAKVARKRPIKALSYE
jgi:putative ABC transport system permease protein